MKTQGNRRAEQSTSLNLEKQTGSARACHPSNMSSSRVRDRGYIELAWAELVLFVRVRLVLQP